MTTAVLDEIAPALREAIDARSGRDLFSFAISSPVELRTPADEATMLRNVDVLKTGTFNGLDLTDGDLDAMVDRFSRLRDGGIFAPPVRLDHSMSVRSVVGYVDSLETYRRVDETDGVEKTFLRANLRITEPDVIPSIRRGTFVNRSSELGGYVTNAGTEFPLVFYGVAFVDIPAVEGLGPFTLRGGEPATVVELHERDNVSEQTDLNLANEEKADQANPAGDAPDEAIVDTPADDDAGDSDDAETPPVHADDEVQTDADDDAADPDPEPVPDTTPDEAGDTPAPDTVAALEAEISTLRAQIARDRHNAALVELRRYESAGVVVPEIRPAAETLLTHSDENVARSARAILSSVRPRVTLDRRAGSTTPNPAGSAGEGGRVIALGMEPDEAGALWASFSTEERAARTDEWESWRRDYYGLND